LKRRRELNVYKDSLVKTITLVPVSIKLVASISLGYNNNKNRLDTVIRASDFKNVHRNKSSTSIKIISSSFPNISFNNKRLDAEVHKNVLFKLEEKERSGRTKYDNLYCLFSSDNTGNMGGRISGSRNRSKCDRMTEMIINCGSPNS